MASIMLHSNMNTSFMSRLTAYGISIATSQQSIPSISTLGTTILSLATYPDPLYSTTPFSQLRNLPGSQLNDFRSRKGLLFDGKSKNTRQDGAALAARGFNARAKLYLEKSTRPPGVYDTFNLNAPGKYGYGWGDHGNINANRDDFTQQSHVTKNWSYVDNTWKPVIDPVSISTAFRGDQVNVIDYQPAGSLDAVYKWKSDELGFQETQDFIKFFFTGPKLAPNATKEKDDVIVFRATIGSISDTFNPQWNPVQLMGRADPTYHYSGYRRDVSVDFTIYATDRDELKPIYRKLNALAGYTTPDYSGTNIGFKGPWMRITVGDLYNQMPVIISSLSYTLGDTETPWEINIEDDPDMMQAPLMVKVSIGFNVIGDWLPQKGGQFYSLSKRFDEFGSLPGSDNWLSDSKQIADNELRRGGLDVNSKKEIANAFDSVANWDRLQKESGTYKFISPTISEND
jgi:hypothetical protein